MQPVNRVLSSYGTTIFETMSKLALEHKSINLGQGFPDGNGPPDVRRMAAEALEDRPNQYPSMLGAPELRQAVAAHAKRFYGLGLDWQSEVMVTSGATEALADCLFALLNPGDEVVLLEPLYDSYLPIIRLAGGVPKLVRLEPPLWELPREALRQAFSGRTKLLLLNTPMNPTGKVFAAEEMQFVAGLLQQHDAYAVCDEVYEHILFDGRKHLPLICLPGMRERCFRIGSAGKTFSLTGWKVGYVSADRSLLAMAAKAHQYVTFTTAPNLQRAVAFGLAKGDDYFIGLASDMQAKRDRFRHGLQQIGFATAECHGTYFINADFRPLGFNGTDEEFCRHITVEVGVTAVPVSAFYQAGPASGVNHFARFCFCTEDQILDAGQLPIKMAGISHCFRTEAGAHGKATRGIYRVHQFTKIEMFGFTAPDVAASDALHAEIVAIEEEIFQGLGIPYRVLDIASGDLGGPAYRKFDLEAWMPGRGEAGEWGEITSASNCTDFQARRLSIRCKSPEWKGTRFVHTLNGTAIAVTRAIIAILENYQQADGSIVVPEALRPWVGKDRIG